VACVKHHYHPNCGEPPHENACQLSATGTLEQCWSDTSLWYITSISQISEYSGAGYLVPVNLADAFKKNGAPVSFNFSLLNDSLPLQCWFSGTPPAPCAKK